MDDELALSSHALQALQEFLQEKTIQEERFKQLKDQAEVVHLEMTDFKEDWQLSQFWYDEETRKQLALEAIEQTFLDAFIGCISAPSAYLGLKKLETAQRSLFVFEFDKRFDVFGQEFVFYDFNAPLAFDDDLLGAFDFLVVDPPFLSDECWSKTSQTVKALLKPGGKILICTGQIMTEKVGKELNCALTDFEPKHQNGLANEFKCFINYPSSRFSIKEM